LFTALKLFTSRGFPESSRNLTVIVLNSVVQTIFSQTAGSELEQEPRNTTRIKKKFETPFIA
jgi:hypothetical protein